MTERVIRVSLDPRGVRAGTRSIQRLLGRVDSSTRRTSQSLGALQQAAGGIIGALGVRQLGQYADQWTNVQNRLRLVTDSQEELNATTDEIVALAQRTRSPLGSVAELYERSARAAERFGISQERLLGITESVNQASQISGATTSEASNAVRQFTQAIAGGVLRAEEFNSIIEQTPRLASAIEEGLGLAAGTLRGEVVAGTVEAIDVLRALENQADTLNGEFAQITPTLAQAGTTVSNFAQVAIGSFNEAAGITEGLVDIFALTADETNDLADTFREAGLSVREFVEVTTVAIANFVETVPERIGVVRAEIVKIIAAITRDEALFRSAFEGQREFEQNIDDIVDRLNDEFDAIARNSQARRDALEAGRGDGGFDFSGGGDASGAASDLRELTDEQDRFLANLLSQEEALAIAAESGREYSDVLEELEIAQLAAGDAAFEFDAIQTLLENRRLADVIDEQNQALEDAEDIFESTRTAAERFNEEIQRAQDLLFEGLIDLETFNRFEENLRDSLDRGGDAFSDFLTRARENAQDVLGGGIAEIFAGGLEDVPEQFGRILRELAGQFIASEIFRLLSGLGSGIGGGSTGGILSSLGTFFGGNFGGGRRDGGPVTSGQPVLVGEGGAGANPEIFVPPQSGKITPVRDLTQPTPPAQITIVNAFDERMVLDAMGSAAGRRVQLNNLTRTRQQTRNALRV